MQHRHDEKSIAKKLKPQRSEAEPENPTEKQASRLAPMEDVLDPAILNGLGRNDFFVSNIKVPIALALMT